MDTGSVKIKGILEETPVPFDADSARASILIVDDEPFVRDIVSRYLTPHGHRVRQASSVNHAREEIRRERPEVVFLDINMPGSSGFELLEELAPRWPEVAVVMATANGDIATAMRAIREGAADYITKPLDCETIRFVLSRTLERRQMYLMNAYYQGRLEDLVEKRTEELRNRTDELIHTQDALVRGLCRLTEFRDHGTGEHLDRMSEYAREIARRLMKTHPELPTTFPDLIHMAAPLHDIGKVGIPDAILLKPGPLTDEERTIMRTHTVIGAGHFGSHPQDDCRHRRPFRGHGRGRLSRSPRAMGRQRVIPTAGRRSARLWQRASPRWPTISTHACRRDRTGRREWILTR